MNLSPKTKYIHMYINDEEVICSNQITVVEELTNVNTMVLENCYPLSWETEKDYTQFYNPKDYSLFKMTYDYTDYDLTTENDEILVTEADENINVGDCEVIAFTGVVKRSQPISLNPTHPHFATLQVLDFKTFLSEGDLFNFVFETNTIKNFINTIIGEYSGYNFSVGNISLSDINMTIGNYNCDQKTLFDVLQYISQITNSIWKVRCISDTNYVIDFYDLDSLPNGLDLVYDTDFCDTNSIIDISYSFNTSNYRNKQVITASSVLAKTINTEEIITNSSNEEYTLANNVGYIISAYLDGDTSLVTATTQDKENGYTADLYYTVGSNIITLNEDVLPTQTLTIQYYPQIEGRTSAFNTTEIERISNQLNNTGTISRYEQRQDATSVEELSLIGQAYLQFKGKPDITLQVKTINKDLWQVATTVYFDNNSVEGIEDLADTYVVTKKTMQIIQNNADSTNQIIYTYELKNNYNFENEINYFDNQRAKLKGNIEEGQFINKYFENIETVQITFDTPVIGG